MKKKISESELVDYLYGELSVSELERIEQALASDPELKKELEELKESRKILQKYAFEVESLSGMPVAPLSFKVNRSWRWVYISSAAAGIAILLITAALSNISIYFDDQRFSVAWGDAAHWKEEKSEVNILQQQQKDLEQKIMTLMAKQENRSEQLEAQIDDRLSLQEKRMTNIEQGSRNNEFPETWASYMAEQQQEQLLTTAKWLSQSNQQQKEYTEALLADFATYLDQQRRQDLQTVETAINKLLDETQFQHLETEMVLAQFIQQLARE